MTLYSYGTKKTVIYNTHYPQHTLLKGSSKKSHKYWYI